MNRPLVQKSINKIQTVCILDRQKITDISLQQACTVKHGHIFYLKNGQSLDLLVSPLKKVVPDISRPKKIPLQWNSF
jgi:hypothetical protein